jgi:hypothetical protein
VEALAAASACFEFGGLAQPPLQNMSILRQA